MLPLELIHHIIDELGSQIRNRDSRTAIQQCARTSRSFRNRARRYMFANVTVIEQEDRNDTRKKVDNLRAILANDSNVVNYFREFAIVLNDEKYLASNESGLVHILNIIKMTLGRNGLNKLTISTAFDRALFWPAGGGHSDFNQAFHTICEACIPKQVEVNNFIDIPLYTLGHCLEVQSFSTTSSFINGDIADSDLNDIFKTYPPTNSSLLPCKWRSLEVNGFFSNLCMALANIVGQQRSPVFGNLEFLRVFMASMFDRIALDRILMSAKNALRTLECVIHDPQWDGPDDAVHTIDIGSVSLPNLQALRLQFHGALRDHESDLDFWSTVAQNILILRPETQPSGSLSKLEIILNLQCDSQGDLDRVALSNDAWTLLDALIVDDSCQALQNVHLEIKVGSCWEPTIYDKRFNFNAFSDFFEKRLPQASRSKTLGLTTSYLS